jgi:hypothetical protein
VLQFYIIFARPSVLEWLKFCQSVSLVVIELKQLLLMGINHCT